MAALALGLTACGAGAGSLDCAWLSEQNCWKTTLAAASSCLPDAGDTGTFAADRASCTYTAGAQIVFTDPVPAPPPSSQRWNFTMLSGAGGCIKLEQPADGNSRVTTQAGTVVLGPPGGDEVVTCPDGTRYQGSANSLSACPGGTDLVPSAAISAIGSTVSLSFRGVAGEPLHVFTCR
ncbi:MAG TPA: hypothetical protein VFL36_02250 [Myxococcales bacterium]|nr:hypothetical protein [Myxococcales bacterium]